MVPSERNTFWEISLLLKLLANDWSTSISRCVSLPVIKTDAGHQHGEVAYSYTIPAK